MKRPRAVILDLGNVLAFHDNEKLFQEMAKRFGCEREAFHEHFDSAFWDQVMRGRLKGDALRKAVQERVGGDVSPQEFVRVWNCHFTLNEPMLPLVERLKDQVPLVLLSNTHDLHFGYLRPKLPVLSHFAHCVLSCEVGYLKPEPEIYALAVKAAGVPAQDCVFFDDIELYVKAAREQGLQAHVYTDAAAFGSVMADYGL